MEYTTLLVAGSSVDQTIVVEVAVVKLAVVGVRAVLALESAVLVVQELAVLRPPAAAVPMLPELVVQVPLEAEVEVAPVATVEELLGIEQEVPQLL